MMMMPLKSDVRINDGSEPLTAETREIGAIVLRSIVPITEYPSPRHLRSLKYLTLRYSN